MSIKSLQYSDQQDAPEARIFLPVREALPKGAGLKKNDKIRNANAFYPNA